MANGGTPFPDIAAGSDITTLSVSLTLSDRGNSADGIQGLNSQYLTMLGNPSSGTFTLSLTLPEGTQTTVPLPWNVLPGTTPANDVQTITMNAAGGTFTVSLGSSTTPPLPWNIGLSSLEAQLWGLTGLGWHSVTVTGVPGIVYIITADGPTATNAFIPTLVLNTTLLTDVTLVAGTGSASLAHTTPGTGAGLNLANAIQSLTFISDTCNTIVEGTPGVCYTISFVTEVPNLTVTTPYVLGQPTLITVGAGSIPQIITINVSPYALPSTTFTVSILVDSTSITYTTESLPFNVAPADLLDAIVDLGAMNSMMNLETSWNWPTPLNDIQILAVVATGGTTNPIAGTFTITVTANGLAITTQPISPVSLSASTIQSALQSLMNVGVGNMTVTQLNDGNYQIVGAGTLAFTPLDNFTVDNSLLLFGNASVTHMQTGVAYPPAGSSIEYTLAFQVRVPLFTVSASFNGNTPGAGNGISFAGNPLSYAVASDAGLPTGRSPRSVSFWTVINASTASIYYSGLFYYGGNQPNTSIFIGIRSVGIMQWCVSQFGESVQGGTVNIDQLYNVIMTYDGTTYSLYVDTLLVASGFMDTNTLLGNGLYFGSDPVRNQFIGASIQDVRIYNRVLSGSDMTTIYNNGTQTLSDGITSGLVRWYKTREGFGTIAGDAISGYTAKLSNATWLNVIGGSISSQLIATAITGYNQVVADYGNADESGSFADTLTENVSFMLSDSASGEEYAIGSPARVAYPDVPFTIGQR